MIKRTVLVTPNGNENHTNCWTLIGLFEYDDKYNAINVLTR